jgi:hypothetical protein
MPNLQHSIHLERGIIGCYAKRMMVRRLLSPPYAELGLAELLEGLEEDLVIYAFVVWKVTRGLR